MPCSAAASLMAEPGANGSKANGWTLRSMLTTKYDKEIVSVAVPALAAMLLEPIMSSINAGEYLNLYLFVGLLTSKRMLFVWF